MGLPSPRGADRVPSPHSHTCRGHSSFQSPYSQLRDSSLSAPAFCCSQALCPSPSLHTCVVGGAPGETITHLHLDTAAQRWAQGWRQWLLGVRLLQKFCECPVGKRDEKQPSQPPTSPPARRGPIQVQPPHSVTLSTSVGLPSVLWLISHI